MAAFYYIPVGGAAKDPELQLSNEEFRGVMELLGRAVRKDGSM